MGVRARQQRELQSRLQTISNFLEGAQIEEVEVSDDPPIYEPPPEYAEIMKKETGKQRKSARRKSSRRRRSKSPNETVSPAAVIPDSPPPPYSGTQLQTSENESGQRNEWTTFNQRGEASTSDCYEHNLTDIDNQESPKLNDSNSHTDNSNRFSCDFTKIWSIFPGKSIGTRKELLEQSCNCEGACGCASTRRIRSESVNIPFMAATWSPATAKNIEQDSQQNHKGLHNLFLPALKINKGHIKGSSSADNLQGLNY